MCLSFMYFLSAGEATGFEEDIGRGVSCFWKEVLGGLGHPPKGTPRGRRSTQSEVRVGSHDQQGWQLVRTMESRYRSWRLLSKMEI